MPARRFLFIANPAARHGETGRALAHIGTRIAHLEGELICTENPRHATEIATTLGTGFDAVVAIGGDGTVHEVLNGIMAIDPAKRPALALVPTGSGNDTRRTLGLPIDIDAALAVLSTGRRVPFDVGRCNGVYFNNSFAAGLDAKVTARALRLKDETRRSGLWLYLTALIGVLFEDMTPYDIRLTVDDAAPVQTTTLIVAVTQGPTYGGGFKITPHANPADGLFETCMIDPLSLPEALARLPFVVAGLHTRMRPVHMGRCGRIIIESDNPMPAQIDGEVMRDSRYAIEMLHHAVECIVPDS